MDDEQNVDKDEQVVWIPESIVASEPVKWLRQLNKAPSEPPSGQRESNQHEDHH